MSDQFYGEIRMFAGFGGTSTIRNWAFCHGTLMSVNDQGTLFSLIGTTYGGNGYTTFALPDMRGRVPVHQGTGNGLTPRIIGSMYGLDYVTLTTENLPAHNHPMQAIPNTATIASPVNAMLATTTNPLYDDPEGSYSTNLYADSSVSSTGSAIPHENCQPSLAISFIIALQGVYLQRP